MNTCATAMETGFDRGGKRGRSRKNLPDELRSWEEVNERLARLGEMERQIRGLQDEFERKVAVLKQELLEASQPMAREKEIFGKQIERFYWAHRGEVLALGRKSIELAFGRVGSRSCRGVVVEDAAAAQQWLAGNGLVQYLRTRTELDREALRSAMLGANATDGDLTALLIRCPGIRLREAEEFWYEVDRAACSRIGPPPEGRKAS